MPRKGISYDDFKPAWLRLEAQGQATIANVRAEIGGSNPTLMKYRDRLREEQSENELKGLELPTRVKQTIFGFAEQYSQLLQKQLDDRINDIRDYQKEFERQEKQFLEEKEKWEDTRKTLENDKAHLDKALAACTAKLDDANKREKELKIDAEKLRERLHQAEIEKAIAQTRSEELEKQLKALKEKGKAKSGKPNNPS